MACRDPFGIRLLTRNGHDWAPRYPLVVEAVNSLKVRSCLITARPSPAANGLAVFELPARSGRMQVRAGWHRQFSPAMVDAGVPP
jgi:hypothetical protein